MRQKSPREVKTARMTNQNQRNVYIFSLMMLSAMMQRASCVWMVPLAPYFMNAHLVTYKTESRSCENAGERGD